MSRALGWVFRRRDRWLPVKVPPTGGVTRLVQALHAHDLAPAVGGSSLLVALRIAEVANDWDVTVDGSDAAVTDALRDSALAHRDGTERGGIFETERRWVIDGGDHNVELETHRKAR